ncbi:MAG: tricarboxylate transporter, partial [Limibacillus sp.]
EFDGDHVGQAGVSSLWSGAFWIALLVGLTALLGFYLALVIFFLSFLALRAKAGPVKLLVLTGAAALFMLLLADALNLNFPRGLLQDYLDLPWPLR